MQDIPAQPSPRDAALGGSGAPRGNNHEGATAPLRSPGGLAAPPVTALPVPGDSKGTAVCCNTHLNHTTWRKGPVYPHNIPTEDNLETEGKLSLDAAGEGDSLSFLWQIVAAAQGATISPATLPRFSSLR